VAEQPEKIEDLTRTERGEGEPCPGRPGPPYRGWNAAILTLWAFTGVMSLGVGAAWLVLAGDDRGGAGLAGALLRSPWWFLPVVLFVPTAALAGARVASASWDGWRKGSAPFALRISVYLLLAGIALTSVSSASGRLGTDDHLATRFCGWTWMVLGIGVLLVFSVVPGSLAKPRSRPGRTVDLLLSNVAVLVLASEAVIGVASLVSSNPILHFDALALDHSFEGRVRETLQRFRFKPYSWFFDRKLNSGGYVDDEFFAAGKRDFVVAVLADSFGVGGGVVPFDYNFATVAERRLQGALGGRFDRVAVHSFGVAGIGLPEYYHLMLTEALPTNPSLVALCVFVGNDIEGGLNQRAPLAGYALFKNWRVAQLPKRLWRISYERRHGNAAVVGTIDLRPRDVPAYVHDYRLEPATFSEQRFMQIEAERVEICDARRPDIADRYEGAFSFLDRFRDVLGKRLLVVLIPDEFQVNDALWAKVVSVTAARDALDRDLPQKRITAHCAARGIAVLDLLRPLYQAPQQEPAYQLRDTHWNARGNRLAGEAIAAWILEHRFGETPSGASSAARYRP
jgi:hypothetical protein